MIKFPSLESWYYFLFGLIHNLDEKKWAKFNHLYNNIFCPIFFTAPLGLFSIMPYCNQISDVDFQQLLLDYESLPIEKKQDSFGYYKNKIVAVDYH